jgi:hypothetical protein
MELVAILATVILLSTVLTLVFAFASYFVSRAKRRLKREKGAPADDSEASPVRSYFERYYPEGGIEEPEQPVRNTEQDNQWI